MAREVGARDEKAVRRRDLTSREDLCQLVRWHDLELRIRAVTRTLVATPAAELRRVPKAASLHVAVRPLGDELGPKRRPGQVLALAPAALHPRTPVRLRLVRLRFRPRAPGMPVEGVLAVRGKEIHELAALGRGKARADADVLEVRRVVEEAEEERADRGTVRVLVPAKAGDDAVALALVLHLEHHALVRLIDARLRLRHHAVQSCPFEAPEPVSRRVSIARRRREVER